MANSKDFKVKNGIQPTVYHEGLGTVTSGSVGYSLASASYDGVSQALGTGNTTPNTFVFNNDGTKLFCQDGNDRVYEYHLSTAYDVTTATLDSNFLLTGQTSSSSSLAFNNDGTKMYIGEFTNDTVLQYTLSTGFDVSTASYDSVTLNVSGQSGNPANLLFNSDGTILWVSDGATPAIYQYNLSTGFDLSTGSYASKSLNLNVSPVLAVNGFTFNSDGTKLLVIGSSNTLYSYTLSIAYDISTANRDTDVSFNVVSQDASPTDFIFYNSGQKMLILGASNDTIYQYSTALNTETLDLSTGSVFEITPTSDIQINLSNPASSGTVSQATLLLDGAATTTYSFSDLSDDSKSYAYTPEPNGIFFKPDGSKLFTMSNSAVAYQHTLTDPNDITTASYDSVSFSLASQDAGMSGLFFKSDGTKIYGVGSVTDTVYQYSLSTAWDLSTASYDSVSLSVSAQDSIPFRLFFKPDGTKMYVDGANGKKIFQYSLSTAWDLSTASYDSISYTYSSTLSYDLGQFFFTSDGTSLYFISAAVPSSAASEQVVGYSTLSTAWDISTIGVRSTFSISSLDTTPYGVQFSVDGVKLFVSGAQNDKVYQLNSSTGATITYPSTLEWPSGTAPTSPAIGDTDVLTFSTTDGGTSYQAVQAINGAK